VRPVVRSIAVLAALLLPAVPARAVIPELNAAASLLLPGLGQAANGDYGAGAFQFGAALVLVQQYSVLVEKDDYVDPDDRLNSRDNEIEINRTSFYADFYGSAVLNLQFYSSFSAYRDARQAVNNEGYGTPAPAESIADLALAPFNWEFLSRPTTFVALAIPLYVALSPVDDERLLYDPEPPLTRGEMRAGFALQFEGVAIGEEAFFRGVLNNGLSSGLGPAWGLLASSTIFGLAHSGSPGQATALGAGLFGLYLGWLHQRNDYQIGQGVALHFWWNFLVAATSLAQREEGAHVTLFTYVGRF
jgi:hypothetical protein